MPPGYQVYPPINTLRECVIADMCDYRRNTPTCLFCRRKRWYLSLGRISSFPYDLTSVHSPLHCAKSTVEEALQNPSTSILPRLIPPYEYSGCDSYADKTQENLDLNRRIVPTPNSCNAAVCYITIQASTNSNETNEATGNLLVLNHSNPTLQLFQDGSA